MVHHAQPSVALKDVLVRCHFFERYRSKVIIVHSQLYELERHSVENPAIDRPPVLDPDLLQLLEQRNALCAHGLPGFISDVHQIDGNPKAAETYTLITVRTEEGIWCPKPATKKRLKAPRR